MGNEKGRGRVLTVSPAANSPSPVLWGLGMFWLLILFSESWTHSFLDFSWNIHLLCFPCSGQLAVHLLLSCFFTLSCRPILRTVYAMMSCVLRLLHSDPIIIKPVNFLQVT